MSPVGRPALRTRVRAVVGGSFWLAATGVFLATAVLDGLSWNFLGAALTAVLLAGSVRRWRGL